MNLPDALVVFDVETTGVDVAEDRFVQAFVGLMDSDGEWIEKREWIIDPGVEIAQGAIDVHGISNELVREKGVDPALAIEDIINCISWYLRTGKPEAKRPLVAFNASFDLSMLTCEARRYGLDFQLEPNQSVIDPFVIDKTIDKYRKGSRKLVDVAPIYGVPVEENAHDAGADCLMTGRIAWVMLKRWTEPLTSLHNRQAGWAKDQRDSLQAYFARVDKLNEDGSPIVVEQGWPILDRAQ